MTDRARLRLHDTAAGVVRDFVPLRPGHVSIYLCGATVQGLPHIGHVRSGVAFDILRRWLLARGYDVAFIRNVTDIEDKILAKAAAASRPWWEVGGYPRACLHRGLRRSGRLAAVRGAARHRAYHPDDRDDRAPDPGRPRVYRWR